MTEPPRVVMIALSIDVALGMPRRNSVSEFRVREASER
jgi:hypothetical protein